MALKLEGAPAEASAARWFLRATLVTVGLLWLVVVTGGLVRLTASGLGCPSWPLCSGQSAIPPAHYHSLIEFGNRVISGMAMIAAVITAVLAWRVPWTEGWIRRLAVAAAAGTVAQIPLGGLTVLLDLNPLMVMSHFLLAMAVVVCAVWVAFEGHRRVHDRRLPNRLAGLHDIGLHAWVTVALYLVLIVSGTLVTAAGPHAGSTAVVVKRFGNFYDAAWLHVRVATAFIVVLAALAWRLRRPASRARDIVVCTVALTLCQFAVGEYQYRNGLPWQVVAMHVTLAVTLLVLVVLLAAEIGAPQPEHAREPAAEFEPV